MEGASGGSPRDPTSTPPPHTCKPLHSHRRAAAGPAAIAPGAASIAGVWGSSR